MYIESRILKSISGIQAGFGTADEPIPGFLQTEGTKEKFPEWKQVHGNAMAWEISKEKQKCGEVDGLHTHQKNIPIAVVTADCVPLLFAKLDGSQGAAIHAGWRGTYSGIVEGFLNQLKKKGESFQNWAAAIGPAIGPCCYEVSAELAEQFKAKFSYLGDAVAVPKYRRLNLGKTHFEDLKQKGFLEKNLDLLDYCTFCSTSPLFHSYRREGTGVRQWSGLILS